MGDSMSLFKGIKIYDEDSGTYKGLHFNDVSPQICAQDYLHALAEGDISGHEPWDHLGYTAGATTSETDVWAGAAAYVFPTAAAAMRCVGGAQDNASGTGAKTIRIYYLDADYAERTTDVVLTGATPVNTSVSNIYRVNSVLIRDWGSGGTTYKAAGNIDVYHASAATVYSRILAGSTRSRNAIYTVPNGKTLYITSVTIGITKGGNTGIAATITLRSNYSATLGLLTPGLHFIPLAEMNHLDGAFYRPFEMPIVCPQLTDIKVSVTAAQASTVVTCALRGWLE